MCSSAYQLISCNRFTISAQPGNFGGNLISQFLANKDLAFGVGKNASM